MRIKYFAAASLVATPLAFPVNHALADDLLEIVITPNRYPTKVENSFQPITVIDRSEIEREQPRSTEELLKNIPGLDVLTSGGHGQQTDIYLRGNSSSKVLVLVDGIRIGSATSGAAAIQTIPPEIIERVEVIRGPRSSLYGGDAMGGVIQIFTRRSQGPAQASVEAGAGSHDTQKENMAITGGNTKTSAGFVVSHYQTEGVNATNTNSDSYTYNADKDGFTNTSAALNVHHHIGSGTDTFFTVLNSSGSNDFDAGPDMDNYTDYTQTVTDAGITSALSKKLVVNAVLGESHDYTTNYGYSSYFNTRKRNANVSGVYSFSAGNDFVAGIETLDDIVVSDTDYVEDSRRSTGLYLQQTLTSGQHSVLLGGRRENIENFGKHNTGNIGYSFEINKNSKITASFGQGFRAPSFNDLYYPGYANPNLVPEESNTSEVDYIACFQHGFVGVNLFHSRYKDLIVLDENYLPQNVGKADIKGVELEGRVDWDVWELSGNLTLLRPLNLDYDDEPDLSRRARKSANLTADYRLDAWKFGATVNARGDRFNDVTNTEHVGGFGTTNLHATWSANKNLDVKFAVYNAGDKAYQTIRGYNAADREFLTSVKVNF